MPRLPAKQREAEKVATLLSNGSFAAAANDAPARFSWEGHTACLLSKLTGNRQKRKTTLESFIASLVKKREEFRKEKKTGAGCTTEAIEFYQFVLDKNASWKAKAGKKPKDSAGLGNGGSYSSAIKSENGSDEENDDADDEFLNQHNDLCEVCAIGGELLCCSTCNLVFHLKCLRPELKSMPPDSWTCAHCEATGVTGLKKDSRQRKKAVQAVREMERLQADIKEKKAKGEMAMIDLDDGGAVGEGEKDGHSKETTEGDSNDVCKICSVGGDLVGCSQSVCSNNFHISCVRPILDKDPGHDWTCAYCDVNYVTGLKPQARKRRTAVSCVRAMDKLKAELDKKRKEGLLPDAEANRARGSKRKLEEGLDVSSPVHPGRPRSQRPKRQRSSSEEKKKDEHTDDDSSKSPVAQNAPQFTREDIPPDLVKKLAPKVTNSNSRHGQYNCKYCMDDETTETCCFCACRVCFIKHDKPSTILCDLCDAEYHTFCLSPALEQIPSYDWFCPTCMDAIAKVKSSGKPGRPPGSKKGGKAKGGKAASQIPTKKGATQAKVKLTLKQKKSTYSSQQPRTSSGRFAPKGASTDNSPSQVKPKPKTSLSIGPMLIKRGPGRPPKSASKTIAAQRAAFQRAQRQATLNVSSPTCENSKSTRMFNASGMLQSFRQQRSSRGRVVKRNTAYDEVEEERQLGKAPNFSDNDNSTKKDVIKGVSLGGSVSSHKGNAGSFTHSGVIPSLSAAAALAANTAASTLVQTNQSQTSVIANQHLSGPSLHASPTLSIKNELLTERASTVEQSFSQPIPKPNSMRTSAPPAISLTPGTTQGSTSKVPRRKPGARECMQISRRFGMNVIPQNYMDILLDYCSRGKVEHLIRMRERLDDHSRFLESQLAGLESTIRDKKNVKAEAGMKSPPPQSMPIPSASPLPITPAKAMTVAAALQSSTLTPANAPNNSSLQESTQLGRTPITPATETIMTAPTLTKPVVLDSKLAAVVTAVARKATKGESKLKSPSLGEDNAEKVSAPTTSTAIPSKPIGTLQSNASVPSTTTAAQPQALVPCDATETTTAPESGVNATLASASSSKPGKSLAAPVPNAAIIATSSNPATLDSIPKP